MENNSKSDDTSWLCNIYNTQLRNCVIGALLMYSVHQINSFLSFFSMIKHSAGENYLL